MNVQTDVKFGKIRSLLFPILCSELKKILPLTLIFLFISFNYALLRGLKDIYVYRTMTKNSIYALKVLVIPSIILFTMLYTFIAKRTNRDKRFNIVISYFFVFFSLFIFVLLPNCDSLQLLDLCNYLSTKFPKYFHWWDCLRVWPVSLFFIHCELWGTIALGVAFWTFANEIVSSIQAKRVYPFLTLGAGVGAMCSGIFMLNFSANDKAQFYIVLFLIIGILFVYNFLAYNINRDPEGYGIEQKIKKNKVKLSFLQSMKFLMKSKYLLLLTCIVFGYNMFIVFLESIWKGRVGSYEQSLVNAYLVDNPGMFVEAKAYAKKYISQIYGLQSLLSGCLSAFWIFFVASRVSKNKWVTVALFTPIASLILSVIFIALYYGQGYLTFFADYFNTTSLFLLVILGLVVLCFIKSLKYVFFDTSKERAYIPLDEESKVNGKAAIDAIGSRLAKGSSSIIISVILTPLFGSLDGAAPFSFVLVFVLISLWIYSVLCLNPEYEKKLAEKEKDVLSAGTENGKNKL